MSCISTGAAPVMFLVSGFVATHAEAATTLAPLPTTTETFNIVGTKTPTDIFIGGSTTAQYSMTATSLHALGNSQIGLKDRGTLPTTDAGMRSGSQPLDFAEDYQLKFDIDGIAHFGLALFDNSSIVANTEVVSSSFNAPRLTTIEYRRADGVVTGAVPEPESWALMIAGLGAVGTAMRVARRRRPLAVAA